MIEGGDRKEEQALGKIADENGWQGSACTLCFNRKKNEDTQCWQEIKHVRSVWHAPARQKMSKSVRKRGSIFHVKHPNWAC